jgi:hypothetical protein
MRRDVAQGDTLVDLGGGGVAGFIVGEDGTPLSTPATATSTHSPAQTFHLDVARLGARARPYVVARSIRPNRALTPRACRRARGTTRARRYRRVSRRCSSRAGPSDDPEPAWGRRQGDRNRVAGVAGA